MLVYYFLGLGVRPAAITSARELQGAARIGRAVLVADLIGDLHDGFGVFIQQVAVDRDAEATGVEPAHAFVEELVATHEDERLKHALLRAALFERVVGGRMELFLGIERLRAADRGLSDVEFGVVGVGLRSPFDDRSLRHGFESCREEVGGVKVHVLQGLVECRRIFVHLHDIGFGAVEQRLLGGEENGNRFVESGSGDRVGVLEHTPCPGKNVFAG